MTRFLIQIVQSLQIVKAKRASAAILGVALFVALGVGKTPLAYGQFVLSSTAIAPDAPIPGAYSCTGADLSPPLSWTGAPASAKSFTLIVQDPDAPGGIFIHWIAYNFPSTRTSTPQAVPHGAQIDGGGTNGMNDFGNIGYNGPCPPPGRIHHYRFRLFALDSTLNLGDKVDAAAIEAAMKGHVVATAELVGTFSR